MARVGKEARILSRKWWTSKEQNKWRPGWQGAQAELLSELNHHATVRSNEGSRLLWIVGLQRPLPRGPTWGGGSIISGAPGKALRLPRYLQYPLVYACNLLMVDKAFPSIMRLKVQGPLEERTVTYIHIQEKVTDDRLFLPLIFIQWKALGSWKRWRGIEARPWRGRERGKEWAIQRSGINVTYSYRLCRIL